MRKKAQRTKLKLLAFEAETWPVEITFRKPISQGRRVEKSPRAIAPKPLRLAKTSAIWASPFRGAVPAGERCR
jgi:hypothetical protein